MRPTGYSAPFSPEGRANLVDPQPHHIGVEAIRVLFTCGEDVARQYLPEPLEPVKDGLGFAYVADMTKVSDQYPDQAYDHPEKTQYGEGIIGIYCRYGDLEGFFQPFIWVDQDWSMLFGHFMGWPKKLARVHRTHLNPFNPAMGDLGQGAKVSGVVDRMGERIFRIGVEIDSSEAGTEVPGFGDRCFMLRHFPSVGPDIPETRQLVSLKLEGARAGDVWSGKPVLEIGDNSNEELGPLRGARLIGGHVYRQGWTTTASAELVHDYGR